MTDLIVRLLILSIIIAALALMVIGGFFSELRDAVSRHI